MEIGNDGLPPNEQPLAKITVVEQTPEGKRNVEAVVFAQIESLDGTVDKTSYVTRSNFENTATQVIIAPVAAAEKMQRTIVEPRSTEKAMPGEHDSEKGAVVAFYNTWKSDFLPKYVPDLQYDQGMVYGMDVHLYNDPPFFKRTNTLPNVFDAVTTPTHPISLVMRNAFGQAAERFALQIRTEHPDTAFFTIQLKTHGGQEDHLKEVMLMTMADYQVKLEDLKEFTLPPPPGFKLEDMTAHVVQIPIDRFLKRNN